MGGGRNPFGQPPMSEEEKKRARERRQEECMFSKTCSYLNCRKEKIRGSTSQSWSQEEEEGC